MARRSPSFVVRVRFDATETPALRSPNRSRVEHRRRGPARAEVQAWQSVGAYAEATRRPVR